MHKGCTPLPKKITPNSSVLTASDLVKDCLVNDPRGHLSSAVLPISPDTLLLCEEKSISGIKPSLFSVRKSEGWPRYCVPRASSGQCCSPGETHTRVRGNNSLLNACGRVFTLAQSLKCRCFPPNEPRGSCSRYLNRPRKACDRILLTKVKEELSIKL